MVVPRKGVSDGGGNGKSTFERHAQTVLGVVVAGGIMWLGNSNVDLGRELAKTTTLVAQIPQMREEMRAMQDQILRMTADRSSSDVRRDVQRLEDKLDRLENRLNSDALKKR